jgi:non-ribosomal peptide synthetase component F
MACCRARCLVLGGASPPALLQRMYALAPAAPCQPLWADRTTVGVFTCLDDLGSAAPLGAPLPNSAQVLDGALQPAPLGSQGELYLAARAWPVATCCPG